MHVKMVNESDFSNKVLKLIEQLNQ